MESRPRSSARRAPGRVASGSRPRKAPATKLAANTHFENIEALIDGNGDITIGSVGPIRCVATAADQDQCLAMLVRRRGESFQDLLQRLDAAIASAYHDEVFIDEVNAPPAPSQTRSKKSRR
jgi:hypothetical protein